MSPQFGQMDKDWLCIQEYREGNSEALRLLRDTYDPHLRSILLARGANPSEADDLLADLWGDCVAGDGDRLALLDKFSGNCSFGSWLTTVATHRLFDLKRKQKLRREVGEVGRSHSLNELSPEALSPSAGSAEGALLELLRESLQKAFSLCPAALLLMLRLVYLHGITQREVGRMWGWHESKVSRRLGRAMKEIEANTLRRIRQTDPWMEITWQDFLDLCETNQRTGACSFP